MTMTMTGGGVSSTIQEPPKMKTETMTGGGGGVSSTKTIQEPSKKMKTETGGGVSTTTIQEPLKKIKRKKKMKTIQEPSKKMKTETGGGGGGVSSTIPEPSKKMKTAAGGGGVPIEELSPNIPLDLKVDGVSLKELSLKELRELRQAIIAKCDAECAKLDVDGAVARLNAACLKAQEVCRQADIFSHEAMEIMEKMKTNKKMKTKKMKTKKMETGGGGGGGVSSTIQEPSKKKMETAAGGGVPIEELSPNIPFKSSRLTPIIPFDLNDPDPKVDGVSIKELSLKEMRELMDAVIAKSNAECAKLDVDGAVARFNATCLKAQEVRSQVDIFYHEAMKIIKDAAGY